MDPLTLAAAVIALLKPFVTKASDQFAGEAGRAVWDKTAALLTRLRSALTKDPAVRDRVDEFVREPDAQADGAQALLAQEFQRDPALRAEIEALIADIKRAGPQVAVVQQMKVVEDVVGIEARRMGRGSASVRQDADHAVRMTGAKIDEIG